MSSNPTDDKKFPAPSSSNAHMDPNSSYTPNDSQLAGLVEAATAAAGHDIQQWTAASALSAASNQQLDGYGTDMHLGDDGFGDANFHTPIGNTRGTRSQNNPQNSGLTRTGTKKRKRNDDNLDPALAGAGISGSQQHGTQYSQQGPHGYGGDNMDIRPAPPQSLPEAPAGVHSAAALFREPSLNKKHTRPPMSKLFASLELSPENFLHLQAAAKAYMLDDQHPKRRDCVGQRGKGDTEMVKLRLWNCVRNFLENEGNGERFFGENVVNENMGPRTYIWPRDQQKIISLVIPLLRRMVTNERQRQYAIVTRKGGGDERRRTQSNEAFPQLPQFESDQSTQMNPHDIRSHDMAQSMPPPPPPLPPHNGSIDPNQPMDLGFADLLSGFNVDWSEISKTYDTFNRDFELDNLWSLSGLQQPDWRGLVAAVDHHYQAVHNGDYTECSTLARTLTSIASSSQKLHQISLGGLGEEG
ncbi:hypothetical protein N7470_001356 [Penicillium chermesinum]|nr:hypothetical protein N7470_001356 [Penicillium chermesinum]